MEGAEAIRSLIRGALMKGNGAFINKNPSEFFSPSLQEVHNLQPRRQPSPEPNQAGLYSSLQICEQYISAIYKSPVYGLPW